MSDGFKLSMFAAWRKVKRSPSKPAAAVDAAQQKSSSQNPNAVESAEVAIALLTQSRATGITPAAETLVVERPQRTLPQTGERRLRRRAIISAPVRLRSVNLTADGPDEVTTTTDVSRAGILFTTAHPGYYRGMVLAVTFPYSKMLGEMQAEQSAQRQAGEVDA